MAEINGGVWARCVLMTLVSLALRTSGQSCTENLSGKGTSFATANLRCIAYPVGSSKFYVWSLKDNSTQATSMVVAAPLSVGNWAGFGFSLRGSMVGSTALVATLNASGTAVATVYNLKGTSSPEVTPGTGLHFVGQPAGALAYFDSASKYVYMSYQVDLASSTPANPGFLVMAFGVQGTGTSLQQHDISNSLSIPGDTVTGIVSGPSAVSSVNKKIKIHGFLNILGWGLLLPIGTMVARYARSWDPAWFYTHIVFQIIGFVCVIAGFATGMDAADLVYSDEIDTHRALGVFLLVLASLQVAAVVLRPKKDAKVRKYWNWYHHWVGRLALFLAVVNIFVGLHMTSSNHGFKVGYISILAIELVAFAILEILMWLRWNKQRPRQEAPLEESNFRFGGNV